MSQSVENIFSQLVKLAESSENRHRELVPKVDRLSSLEQKLQSAESTLAAIKKEVESRDYQGHFAKLQESLKDTHSSLLEGLPQSMSQSTYPFLGSVSVQSFFLPRDERFDQYEIKDKHIAFGDLNRPDTQNAFIPAPKPHPHAKCFYPNPKSHPPAKCFYPTPKLSFPRQNASIQTQNPIPPHSHSQINPIPTPPLTHLSPPQSSPPAAPAWACFSPPSSPSSSPSPQPTSPISGGARTGPRSTCRVERVCW